MTVNKGPKWGPEEERRSQMVFIGRNLQDGMLEAAFKQCVYEEGAMQPAGV